jgi:PDZ domain
VIVAGFKRHTDTGGLLPAEASGRLSVGDVLCAVDGHSLDGLSPEAAALAIREVRQRGRSDSMLLTVRPQRATTSSSTSTAAPAPAAETVSPVPNVPLSGFTSPAPASVSALQQVYHIVQKACTYTCVTALYHSSYFECACGQLCTQSPFLRKHVHFGQRYTSCSLVDTSRKVTVYTLLRTVVMRRAGT